MNTRLPGLLRGLVLGALVVSVVGAIPGPAAAATLTVDCDHASLATALAGASAGSTILISGHCKGVYSIDADLTLRGHPTATIDAHHSGVVFTVGQGLRVSLSHLVIENGKSTTGGGIVLGAGVALSLSHVIMRSNETTDQPGGAVSAATGDELTVTDSVFRNNSATDASSSSHLVIAGAIYSGDPGFLTVVHSTFSLNKASASSASAPASAIAGAIYSLGTLDVRDTVFDQNAAETSGANEADAYAGAIEAEPARSSAVSVRGSTFTANASTATSTNGPAVAGGGAAVFASYLYNALTTLTHDTFAANRAVATSSTAAAQAVGGSIDASTAAGYEQNVELSDSSVRKSAARANGGTSATANGGGIWLSTFGTVDHSQLVGNRAICTSGSGECAGYGGGVYALVDRTSSIRGATVSGNTATGSSTGADVETGGGGIYVEGPAFVLTRSTVSGNAAAVTGERASSAAVGGGLNLRFVTASKVTNSTVASNVVRVSPNGSGVDAFGGGIASGSIVVRFATITRNAAAANGSGEARGGGIYAFSGASPVFTASVLVLNSTPSGPNCTAAASSGGYNVFGSLTSCTLAKKVTDRTATKPRLGKLADNGGPTDTVALQPKSPALNRMPTKACRALVHSDQRGVKRPQGTKCDAGAYEKKA